MDPLSVLWLYFILASLQPVLQRQWLASQRRWQLSRLSRKRAATVITLIHRQETMSLLGWMLFPQPRGREAAVEYVPAPRLPGRRRGRR